MRETKRQRDERYLAAWETALEAGREAGNGHAPRPMVVQGGKQTYFVPEGLCGFAWIVVKPGTSAFARWLKANTHARKAYRGGVSYWLREFGQSYERKRAAARAMADVLTDQLVATAGDRLDIYAQDRLD